MNEISHNGNETPSFKPKIKFDYDNSIDDNMELISDIAPSKFSYVPEVKSEKHLKNQKEKESVKSI